MVSRGAGFADIQEGTDLTVKGGDGKLLAIGKLSNGKVNNGSQITCDFEFTINDVPQSNFYTIGLGSGNRGGLNYSLKDLEAKKWKIGLVLNQ